MRLLGIDIETTGLDVEGDEITELGWVLVDTVTKKPLLTESYMLQVAPETEIPELITELTGITKEMLDEFGDPPAEVFDRLLQVIKKHEVDYIVAHNGNAFDKPFLYNRMRDWGFIPPEHQWLDTKEDIVYPRTIRNRSLVGLCAEHGFVNPFPHAALFDVMSMMKLLSEYNVDTVIERANTPWVVVRAMVSFENKDKAKDKQFFWEKIGDKTYPKCWVKKVKEDELEALEKECDFEIVKVG